MKTAQKIKIIPMLLLLWSLPLTTLPRVTAKAAPAENKPTPAGVNLSVSENYGKLPLSFESNVGQSAKAVKFLSRGSGYTMFLTATEAVFSLRQVREKNSRAVWRLQLAGANQSAPVEGQESLPGKVNYMIGNDRSQWHTGNGVGDIVFNFGQNGDIPLAGDWDGKPSLP